MSKGVLAMFLCSYLKSLKLISDTKNMNERVEKRIQKALYVSEKEKIKIQLNFSNCI